MIETLPTGWRGRALALGLTLAALAVAYAVLVAPLLNFYAERASLIETRGAQLAKFNAIAHQLPALRARLAEISAAGDSNKFTLAGNSDAIAAAALQSRTEELATATGVTIGSTESLAAQAQGTYHRIGLRLVLSAPYASLLNMLSALETARPPLIVDELQVHSFQRRPGSAASTSLDASLQVYAFRADEAGASAKP